MDAATDFFVVVGTVPPGALSYVVRDVDDDLLKAFPEASTPTS